MKETLSVYFQTLDQARKQLDKMVQILLKNNEVYHCQASYLPLPPKMKFRSFVTIVKDSIPSDIRFLCIIQRPEQNPNNQLPQKPYFISSINDCDIEINRAFLIPLIINPFGKIEETLINPRLDLCPTIFQIEDRLVIDLISTFNMNEMDHPQIKNYPFQIPFVYDIRNTEIVYELEEQNEVAEKEFRFFKTKGQEIAFALLKHDGRQQHELLKIKKLHFLVPGVAIKWLEDIGKELSLDSELPKGIKEKAFEAAKNIYDRQMLGSYDTEVFTSHAEEIAFFCSLEGRQRNNKLQILDIYYEEPEFATLWKNNLIEILTNSEISPEKKMKSIKVIEDLYNVIIDEDNAFEDNNI